MVNGALLNHLFKNVMLLIPIMADEECIAPIYCIIL